MTSYAEQAQHNPALAAYVQAEIARACVRLASLEAEHVKDQSIIEAQARKIQEQAEQIKALEKKRK
jgi:hypothetical protein